MRKECAGSTAILLAVLPKNNPPAARDACIANLIKDIASQFKTAGQRPRAIAGRCIGFRSRMCNFSPAMPKRGTMGLYDRRKKQVTRNLVQRISI